ncbi:MAG TPA: PadR family transcriptional regulator [Alphaproteobacteria bacterium]|jgi:DNA-binding PadR family transcriptional regulator
MRPTRGHGRGGWTETDGLAGGWDKGERGMGRAGGRRRMFDNGELRLLLLMLIGEQPRHGYDLIRGIEERTGGVYAPSPGVVYPTLTLLADIGVIVEQEAEGARKVFAITPQGTTFLAENADHVTAMTERLKALAENRERGGAIPLRRAMHNLRSVLMNKLSEGVDKDRIHSAVALIDEAARKIEQL